MKTNKKKINLYILLFLIILGLIKMYPYFINEDTKLKHLNYSSNAITEMKKYNIDEYVLDKNRYSKTLEQALINRQFVKNNLDLYYSIEYKNDTEFIANINKLVTIGYNKAQILLIEKYLDNSKITTLVNKDYIPNIDKFIVIDYFKINNIDRYISYKEKYASMSYGNVITHVNIGLDYPFYKNIKEVSNLDNTSILVNKYSKLPSSYVPNNLTTIDKNYSSGDYKLVKEACDAFEKMCEDATKEGMKIKAMSTYRSYAYQNTIYNNYVKKDGVINADTYSARPGHSEHQTGLAVDIMSEGYIFDDFVKTKEFTWVVQNIHKYGFIIRYPEDKTNITGYKYEPWHLRYVGVDIASYIYENNITFDEYFIKFLDK